MEWINIANKLPENSETNILTILNGFHTIMRGAYLHYILNNPGTTDLIPTHWMPLPEPPVEE